MANPQIRSLKERKRQEALREELIQYVLTSRNKILEQGKREKKQKKKTISELYALLNFPNIENYALRPLETYVPRSCNLERQMRDLLRYLFVKYPVPGFLYTACYRTDKATYRDYFGRFNAKGYEAHLRRLEQYRCWFLALAQGGSFPKLVKSSMTAKEAHLFLSAPDTNQIHENVWWAKMKAAGLPANVIEKLIEQIFTHYYFDDPDGRMAEVIQFYARFHSEMNKVTFGEVTDFLVWKLRQDQEFRLKGRTVSSVVKLTHEWHLLMHKAKMNHLVEWKGSGLTEWRYETKDTLWTVIELLSNRDLMNEGRRQHHCVYSYVNACASGNATIFSLRCGIRVPVGKDDEGKTVWGGTADTTCLTIQVNRQRDIVQVRGRLNRLPNADEKQILRHWAGEKGLRLNGY